MRVLSSIVQFFVLPMLHTLEHLLLSGFVAFELVCHDHPWNKALLLQELAKKSLGCLRIPLPLHEDVEHLALRVHCSPQIGFCRKKLGSMVR